MSDQPEPNAKKQSPLRTTTPTIITTRDLDPEEAETQNVAHLDSLIGGGGGGGSSSSSNNKNSPSSNQQRGYEHMQHFLTAGTAGTTNQSSGGGGGTDTSGHPAPSFKSVARRVMLMQKLQQQQQQQQRHQTSPARSGGGRSAGRYHRKNKSSAADLLDQIIMASPSSQDTHDHKTIFHSAGISVASSTTHASDSDSDTEEQRNRIIQEEEEEEDEEDEDRFRDENLPLVVDTQYGSIPNAPGDHHGGTSTGSLPTAAPANKQNPLWKRHISSRRFIKLLTRCDFMSGVSIQQFCWIFLNSYLMTIAMPLFVAAAVLYYTAGNPPWSFIPGRQHSAWLLNFVGRQVVTLELARFTQWLVLDCTLLGSRHVAHWVGPFVTMTAVQSRGWPFVLAGWAGWDLLILRGDGEFQSHWLYWTGWRLYTVASSGQYILTSDMYWHFLVAMIAAGTVTTAKRMFLTIRFGRRTLVDFKPSLEKLLADMILVSEIADLAVEAAKLSEEEMKMQPNEEKSSSAKEFVANRPRAHMPTWSSVKFEHTNKQTDGSESEQDDQDQKQAAAVQEPPGLETTRGQKSDRPTLSRSPTGSVLFKNRLEKWEEPQNKLDKSSEATIQDVLKFRHALNYMDDVYPFGKSYGKASDRNEAIDCSHSIYHKLLKCSPESQDLPFEVLSWITFDEKDSQDRAKLMALRRCFHPDARNNLPLLAFVQSCDTVYKRFRYFKASVSNASVIDNQLERIVNYFFWLFLIMMVLFIMQINPWPLLVSMTSLLVSVSFAMGPSVSKYVEGILLIAVRRPFDLGDRILINSTESADSPGGPMGWFVEDITLSSTTLRFSKSNEIATVSNFAMSQSKIVNCQRSPNAIVLFKLKLHRKILDDKNLEILRDKLQKYVRDNPRIWDSMLFIRHDYIGGVSTEPGTVWSPNLLDSDYQFVIFTLCFQHRIAWQSAARIMMNRAELIRHIYDICLKLGVQYDDPAPRRVSVQHISNGSPDPNAGVALQQSDPFTQSASGQIAGMGH